MKERMKTHLSTGVFLITVVGILVLVNLVSARMFGRLDLTEDGRYSLSDASINLMKNLDDQVIAKAYFTDNLPSPYNSHTRFVEDLFEEYAAYSKGNFKYEFVDPGTDDDKKNEMMLLGIPPVQIQEIRDDKFEVKQAFLGIVFYYADKKEIIPLVRSTQGLEYDFTSTIKRLTTDKRKIVGFLQGHGEPNPKEEMKHVMSILEQNYIVQMIDLTDASKGIPVEVDSLVILSPTNKYEEDALIAIDQYLMKGRTVAFFTDVVNVNLQTFQANIVETGLGDILRKYGITINNDLIGDLQNQRINVSSQQGQFVVTNVVNYPLIPIVTDFNKDNTLTSKMEALPFSFASSLVLAQDTEDLQYTSLAKTSEKSWQQIGLFKINPMQDMSAETNAKLGPFTLMATAKGKFESAFANKQVAGSPGELLTKSPETRILVAGDGSFAMDKFADRTGSSAVFFTNCMDWLVQDESLIAIRGQGIQNKPIAELEGWQKNLIKYANIIGVPILLIIFGLLKMVLRKARRKGFQLASGSNN